MKAAAAVGLAAVRSGGVAAAIGTRWCSGTGAAPAPADATETSFAASVVAEKQSALAAQDAEWQAYLQEKWKHDPVWPYPGVAPANLTDVQKKQVQRGELIHRPYGIYDAPPVVNVDPMQKAAQYRSFIKDNYPMELRENWPPMKPPMQNDALYEKTETPDALQEAEEEPLSWVIRAVTDQPSWEEALGEQVFRTTDMDKLSTELYPVGYGLACNTAALIVEDETTANRFYHICGGRSDHKTFVEGRAFTLRADIELFLHVLNYFGEQWGTQGVAMKYHHKYRGLCAWGQGFDDDDEEFVNGFFEAAGLAMRCDPDRLDEACEGYVPVLFSAEEGCSVPNSPAHWNGEKTGIFIWQTFFQSVNQNQNKDPQHIRNWWCDPFTLRRQSDIKARAITGHAQNNGDPEFHLKWGTNGDRGLKIQENVKASNRLSDQEAFHIGTVYSSEQGHKVNEGEGVKHGMVHPLFTTSPDIR